MHRTDGRVFPDYPVRPAPIERLRAGVTVFGAKDPTDAEGVRRYGIFPGEAIGLHPAFDTWTVSAGAGTAVERLTTGYYPSFVITTRAEVLEPAIDIVAEPYQQK